MALASEPLTFRSGSRLPMASFHDAIEMAESDDEELAGSAGGDDHHHGFDDDELPFLEPAARADMIEGSDDDAEGAELPGLASEDSEGEDEHARPPPPPVLPAHQGMFQTPWYLPKISQIAAKLMSEPVTVGSPV